MQSLRQFMCLLYLGTSVILEHAELKERTQLLEMQARQYRTLQEHMRQTARLRHDFRHSVRLLSSLAERGHRQHPDTSCGIRGQPCGKRTLNYCASAALNALFSHYHEIAVSSGIETDWHIELPELSPANELDIVSLFGNLIENAIDGCLTVPGGQAVFLPDHGNPP